VSPRRPSPPAAFVGVGLAAALALGACSASGTSGASSAGAAVPAKGAAPAPSSAAAGPANPVSPANPASADSAGTPTDLAAADKLVRTASMQVQVEDVEAGAADVRRLTVAAGGMVVSENSTAVPSGTAKGSVDKDGSRSVLALAVPSDTLDGVLDDVGKLGTTVNRSSSSRDVTATYVDTQSRLTTMRAGLDQLRALLAKTTALDQVVTLETEISRRQADLDAMQAQLNALDKKVAMSTLTVTLVTAAQVVVAEEDGTGFLGGLRHGWAAFLTTLGGILTVLGAVLPFVALLALLGLPVYVWLRRRRSAVPSAPVTPATPVAPGAPSTSAPSAPAGGEPEPGNQSEKESATAP
jgi:hypothetical protein